MNLSPIIVLILVSFALNMLSSKKKKNASPSKPAGQKRPVTPPAPRQPSAERTEKKPAAQPAQPAYLPHRGEDGVLHPTERHEHAAVSLLTMEGAGMEGHDPCHEYMLDDPALPLCEDTLQETAGPAGAPFSLSFTKDQVVNAVVMSEILNRRRR